MGSRTEDAFEVDWKNGSAASVLDDPSTTLRVTLLAPGSPIPVLERFGPSTLIEAGSEKVLIDCGRGSSLRLWESHVPLGALNRVKPQSAVYSHVVLVTTDPAFPAPTSADVLSLTRETYHGPLELGEDLMSIEIGDKINVRRPVH